MRVGFNARVLAAPYLRGWTRYAVQLLRYLPQFGAELVLFTDRPLRDGYLALLPRGSFRVVQSPAMRYLAWEQAWLPVVCAREGVAVLHSPSNYGLPAIGVCPSILTLHDAIDVAFKRPVRPLSLRNSLLRASFWIARHAASKVITVSAHAKADLGKYFGIPDDRMCVIHEASDVQDLTMSADQEQAVLQNVGIDRPFVLYVGGFEPRKNVEFLVDGFLAAATARIRLVLVGSDPPQSLVEHLKKRGAQEKVCLMGFVPDATLAVLYRRAVVFVYPSLYEGFGLQLCEAMSAGCPVLAADATSLPEVLGRGGETFSPTDQGALVALLRRVLEDIGYRDELVVRARRRAADFSWRRTAQLTYEVYRSCL